jgi:hypothetical protein
MNENPPVFEIRKENLPTLEDVRSIFMKLTEGKYEEGRNLEDEEGLYMLEAKVPGNSPEEWTEYTYMRKGHHQECGTIETGIDKVCYENGSAFYGEIVARYVEGEWEFII